MKRILAYALVFSLIAVLFAGAAFSADDIKEFPSCKYCGMNRDAFSKTRMLIEYDDGSKTALCSLHCASVDLALNIDKSIKSLWVGDYQTGKLVNAFEAFWVIGSEVPGVMTRRSKVAFEKKEDAAELNKLKKGEIISFEQAIKAAYEDMYADTQMIREKRKMKKMKQMEHMH